MHSYGRFSYQDPASSWVRLDQDLIAKGLNLLTCRQLSRIFDPKDLGLGLLFYNMAARPLCEVRVVRFGGSTPECSDF